MRTPRAKLHLDSKFEMQVNEKDLLKENEMLNANLYNRDPYRRFAPLYGFGEQGQEVVPSYTMIRNFRDSFHASRMRTVEETFKRAASKRGEKIVHIGSKWLLEPNSMLYVVTEVSSSRVLASPLCIEVGLYEQWEHLQKLSLNTASLDVLQDSDRDGNKLAFAYQVEFGDVIVVLDVGFYKPNYHDEKVSTALRYYIVNRTTEPGMCMAVKQKIRNQVMYIVYKSAEDVSYEPCSLTENRLRSKLERSSLPTAHLYSLPNVFLLKADILLPYRKCYRYGLNFNRNHCNQSLVREFLEDTAILTKQHVANYMPYMPHSRLVNASFYNTLEGSLSSGSHIDILHGLKCLRAAKLQSSDGVLHDSRLVHFETFGTTDAPDGSIFVQFRSTAAISFRSFKTGSYVEVECGWNTPLIGYISSLDTIDGSKRLIVVFSPECGFIENEDLLGDNIVNNAPEWHQIRQHLSRLHRQCGVRSFDVSSSWDILMSSENEGYFETPLGNLMIAGMADAARSVNRGGGQWRQRHRFDAMYDAVAVEQHNLSEIQIQCYASSIRKKPTDEQLFIFSVFLNPRIRFHVVESCFGSGKTTTAVSSATALVTLDPSMSVSLLAQTNSAVNAMVDAAHLGDYFDPTNLHKMKVRPLVVQSNNWKLKKGQHDHPYDHKVVMSKVFVYELQNTDPTTAFGDSRSMLKSMFLFVSSSDCVSVPDVLPKWKIQALSRFQVESYTSDETYNLFLGLYKPNMFFATTDMWSGYASSTILPSKFFPSLIVLDESTMIQPSDLATFASKMERQLGGIRYILFGDMKQLEPFNTIQPLASILKSPNEIYLSQNNLPSRLTTVYRCHDHAVTILSEVFYSGRLRAGRPATTVYIQDTLPRHLFPKGPGHPYHFCFHEFQSKQVVQSRSNLFEARQLVTYANQLVDSGVPQSSIVVITPFTAQRALLRQLLPGDIQVHTTRKIQGGECDVALFSACHSGNESLSRADDGVQDSVRVQTINSKTVGLISDPSIVLVSLSRARHFTTIFGHEDFLRSIEMWDRIISLAGY